MSALLTRRRRAGFTLIELLIVVIIIGILLAIGVPAYLSYQAKAKDTDAKSALMVAYKAAVAGDSEVSSGRFPVASTVVQDIQADEPQVSVIRGDCVSSVETAPVKQLLVDPSSTTTQLTLCTRSASGSVWTLAGPLTGTPTVTSNAVPLTFSGNEITDTMRAASTQGDGLPVDSSTGFFHSSTNLALNGGFESNSSHWFGANSTTISQDTTTAKFGHASLKCATPGAVAFEGCAKLYTGGDVVPAANGQTWTFSVWAKGTGTVQAVVQGIDSSNALAEQTTGTQTTLTGQWQLLTATRTFTNAATVNATARVITSTTQATIFWIDGAQLEQSAIATPYIETNGAAAGRSSPRVQAPATAINATQGWVAVRVRMGWSSAATPPGHNYDALFSWGDDGNNRIDLILRESDDKFELSSNKGGAGYYPGSASALAFNAGDTETVIGSWTATTQNVSVNGGAFTVGSARTAANIPVLSAKTFDIGNGGGWLQGIPLEGDVLWFACGTGTLTNADAATITSWGNTDPARSAFPAAAQATLVWDGTSASGSLK